MKLALPKSLAGYGFDKVLPVELNDVDAGHVLPSLFFLVVSEGRMRARRPNDPRALSQYLDAMARHPDLQGFADAAGRRSLERLVRGTLVTMGTSGRAHRDEQILSLVPYSLLSYRSGFPAEARRARSVDRVLYHTLLRAAGSGSALHTLFVQAFGAGVLPGDPPTLDGCYDGTTPLDLLTRLSLLFIAGLKPTPCGSTPSTVLPCASPAWFDAIGHDLFAWLRVYAPRMPRQALIRHLVTLINLEMFLFSRTVTAAVTALARQPDQLPAALQQPFAGGAPPLYLDFTAVPHGASQRLAQQAVRRDIEQAREFFSANQRLRLLDRYWDKLAGIPRTAAVLAQLHAGEPHGPAYLQALLRLGLHPATTEAVDARAEQDVESIRDGLTGDDAAAAALWPGYVAARGDTALERLVRLVVEAQEASGMSHVMKWFADTGGIERADGILQGTRAARTTWRYEPGNDLLAVLLQLVAARRHHDAGLAPHAPLAPLRLRDVLAWLAQRFGILIDRPPPDADGAEHHAAARDNLRAMLARLRQMGLFSDASDDFTVQRIHPPYARAAADREE